MQFLKLLQQKNQSEPTLTEAFPWDFAPKREHIEALRDKVKRKAIMADNKTDWSIYSGFRGAAPNLRISKENPIAGIRAFVADYDMRTDIEAVQKYLEQVNPSFLPNFIEITLSKRIRLLWLFEREVLVPNNAFAERFLHLLMEKLKASTLLAGYDHCSERANTVWTNGGEWYDLGRPPLSWKILFGFICDTSKHVSFGREEIPLEKINEQVQALFPGRWQGDFKVNATGVRFWDESADNTNGCQVKPDGMLCFTGTSPFMKWDQLFGAQWCNEQRAVNLGKLAGEIYYDGKHYWEFNGDRWNDIERQDVILNLKANGLSASLTKGQTASECEKVLTHIQKVNRIVGAAPIINQRPGLITFEKTRILNISTIQALQPAAGPASPEKFKFIHNYLWNLPARDALLYMLAWTRRAYWACLHYERLLGQAMFICGPRENGKTLFAYRILKPLLGDRWANPFDYFVGQTGFNDDLFQVPLLAINDEEGLTREDVRQKFVARMKAFVANPSHVYSAKFRGRITVEWTGRFITTCNNDAASTGILPEVNHNTEDKMMFVGTKPYADAWPNSRELERIISDELPHFARWLIDWEPPAHILSNSRMGVKSYYDLEMLEFSRHQLPGYEIYERIRTWCADDDNYWDSPDPKMLKPEVWQGNPSELGMLINHDVYGKETYKVPQIYRALRRFSEGKGTGVEYVPGKGRMFRINREKVLSTKEANV